MERIGIRALQQHASGVLRRVRDGELLEVTDRGHPVALLVPAVGKSVIDAMKASGRLTSAEGDLLDLGAPLTVKRGVESASTRLARMRERERAPVRVRIDATNQLGRALQTEGRCVNRLHLLMNPNLFGWNSLTEWRFSGLTAWGEDRDNWTAAAIRRFRRATLSP